MVIYDFGANHGQNLRYFLSKAEKVVAVEANPVLCDIIKGEFASELESGKLVLVNCCLSVDTEGEMVDFYVHTKKPGISQFGKPDEAELHNFKVIQCISKRPSSIIKENGTPYYVKIDLEFYDRFVLQELFANNIVPELISVEVHEKDVYDLLLNRPEYISFNAVSGEKLTELYPEFPSKKMGTFTLHCAGPFGSEIRSPWLTRPNVNKMFKEIGLGWYDLHASTKKMPYGEIDFNYYTNPERALRAKIRMNSPLLFRFLKGVNWVRLKLTGKYKPTAKH